MDLDITGPAQQVVDLLRSAGLNADTNTDRLNPPCVWVAHERLEIGTTLDGAGDVHLSLFLAAPDTGYDQSMTTLQTLLRDVLQVVTPDDDIELNAGLQTSAGVLPAFRFPLTLRVSI